MRWLTICLTCHLVLFSAVAFCAEPEKPGGVGVAPVVVGSTTDPVAGDGANNPLQKSAEGAIVREAGPPVYYLKNQEGKLVPMLGFEYEDFIKLLRQEQRDPAGLQPAQFTIDQTDMNGTVHDGRAHLDIQLKITTRQAGSIRVPIGLSQAIVREDLKYDGDGSAFLDYDAKKKEYVVWIEGKKDQKHELSLSVAISTATIGLDTRLRFDAPRSTRSLMTITIPETGLDVHAPVESRLSTTEEKETGKKETRLRVDSVRGDFQLLWHKPPTGSSNTRTVMEASGEIIVNISPLDVTCEALLRVRGRGMPLDRFRIRLPKGTATYQVSDGDYRVTEVEEEKPGKKVEASDKKVKVAKENAEKVAPAASKPEQNQDSRVIEVRLSKPTLEPVLLHVTTTRPLDQRSSPNWIEPAGFEVIDAIRQWGHVATVIGPDHFVSWLPERGIRRVDNLPGTMTVKNPAAVFEYYSAPFQLKTRIAPRRTRVSVEPEHIVHVGADQLKIDSTLRYTIRGKRVLSLELDLGNWELDDIGPETLVDVEGIEISPTGLVSVPLLRPTIGHTQLKLKAHRAAPQQESKLEIAFPRPSVDSPGPAVVVILPDDNVKLLPDATASTGLSRLQATPSIELPVRQQPPLFYQGDASQATFLAERSIHKRQVSVDIRSMVAFEMLTMNVEQSFTYQIDHEPSDQIVLDVPESLTKSASIEFLVDGVLAVPRVLNETITQNGNEPKSTATQQDSLETDGPETNGKNASKTVPVVLTLKPALIGRCVVTVRYSFPRRVLIPNTPMKRQIPLVLPAIERILHHELSIVSPLGLMVEVLEDQTISSPINNGITNDSITKDGVASSGDTPGLDPIVDAMISKSDLMTEMRQKFNVIGRLGAIEVLVSIERRLETPLTTIQRAFFQTWVTSHEYQNRALFQFQSRQKQIELSLPSETIDRRVNLLLNGTPLPLEPLGEHRYLITLPNGLVGLQQLELRWSSQPSGESRTALKLGMPQLGEDAWIQRWYWQLLLPTGEHLLGTPKQVLSESSWKWDGGVFQREPFMNTNELERWVGAEASTNETPAANLYLFSSFGPPEEIQFRVASRSLIVLIASSLMLIVGFLLIYIPATRHPASLLVLGVVLGSLGVMYPEPMLLGLQASSIGVILVGLTAILKRRVTRPQLPSTSSFVGSGGSSILDRDSTQRQVILPPVISQQDVTETQFKPPE